MPLLALRISETIYAAAQELVEAGKYRHIEQFLEVAAINQIALERGAAPEQLVNRVAAEADHAVLHEPVSAFGTARGHRKSRKPSAGRITRTTRLEGEHEPQANGRSSNAFALDRIQPERLTVREVTEPAADDDYIFGQVNRYFPFKVGCRGLAVLASRQGTWPRYPVMSEELADDAATLGSILEAQDLAVGRRRDEQLATGLPKRANTASRDRFLSQLIARVTRGGDIYPGALCQYQLAVFADDRLELTQAGLAFARLTNPVLDTSEEPNGSALGDEEIEFLLHQIVRWVPRERADMSIVLTEVVAGSTKPSMLTESVRKKLPQEWNDAMVMTHISGLIARLVDLHILRREWQGRYVEYGIGDERHLNIILHGE